MKTEKLGENGCGCVVFGGGMFPALASCARGIAAYHHFATCGARRVSA